MYIYVPTCIYMAITVEIIGEDHNRNHFEYVSMCRISVAENIYVMCKTWYHINTQKFSKLIIGVKTGLIPLLSPSWLIFHLTLCLSINYLMCHLHVYLRSHITSITSPTIQTSFKIFCHSFCLYSVTSYLCFWHPYIVSEIGFCMASCSYVYIICMYIYIYLSGW